ncbi:MAG TPA: VanZ family protein [Thermoanaerobaculia bacterium]|nr:VanZ family protein [Thermoanaerobaculia bacterium]
MGRAEVRVVRVGKRTTVLLLLLVTAAIIALTLWMSGKAYTKVDPIPFREIRLLQQKLSEGPVAMPLVVALVMPTVLNVLIFTPWGLLMFIALDTVERPTNQSYLLTVLFAIAFSAGIEAWQYFLPTRVTDVNDVIANGIGAFAGAVLGHLRKRVRVSFE